MAGVVSNDQWSIREKLCLASSVIRSGDQNWVSVSRAIKPFGETGRPSDWFSQKNCACQYSALLETVETPKRKRSERGEVVDTPGDLIVRKMTQERIVELKAQLEEDKVRYRQLQREIEQIRSGQSDDRLQSMWDDIQEQKQAAKEAEEAQRLAAETAKAAAAAKPAAKPGFQSPSKRRPQAKNPRPGSRTPSTDNAEAEENVLTSSVKTAEAPGHEVDSSAIKQQDGTTLTFLTTLATANAPKEQEVVAEQEELIADPETDEAAEKLLAATASDLVELLSPYPEDSPSSQTHDDSLLPTTDTSAQSSKVKEPIILLIQKGVAKSREPQVESKGPQSDAFQETETVTVDEPVLDRQPTIPQDKNVTPATKNRADAGDDSYLHIEPPSPEDSTSRDDGDSKVKKKPGRGRPLGSQRKSSRIRTNIPAEEEDDHPPDTPSGRRSAGKDGTASSIASLIGDDSKDDTHSEAGDSDVTDKPSEGDRDDLSASAGGMQSSFFLDSLPNSPASVAHSEEDHAYKIWRKAIMLVWRAIASHKYANVFLHPVTEDIAPGYQSIVLRPMNLITIKKNIESGVIRTTDQFHRDMMLMFQNAIMYNNADQHVHQIATIMQADVVKQIEEFVSTQLLVQQPDSTKMLRGRGKQGQGEEERSRRSSTDTDTSGKKRRTRADEY